MAKNSAEIDRLLTILYHERVAPADCCWKYFVIALNANLLTSNKMLTDTAIEKRKGKK